MNANCKLCGAILKKGNIKVVRKKGKRPFRICRRCPDHTELSVQIPLARIEPPESCPRGETTGNGLQRPQDTTGGPVTVEAVWKDSPPPRYRFFITQGTAAKLRRAIGKGLSSFGVSVEVIPVPEFQVEANPDSFDDLVEVTVDWKDE